MTSRLFELEFHLALAHIGEFNASKEVSMSQANRDAPETLPKEVIEMVRVMRLTAVLVVACLTVGVVAQPSWKPAKLRDGTLPLIPVQAVSAGEVFVEVAVTDAGLVGDLTTLRTTPPFTQAVLDVLRGWRFQPAEEAIPRVPGDPRSIVTQPVQSKVVVACLFRAPTMNTPTVGDPPKTVKSAAEDVAVPLSTVMPPYPPLALFDATVLVQVTVDVNGKVVNATTVRPAAGFDQAALTAARQWTFRPARIHGRPEETFAYIVFAFRQPVTLAPTRRGLQGAAASWSAGREP